MLNLDKDHEDKYNAAGDPRPGAERPGNRDSVAEFGGRAAVLEHIDALFDGSRVVHLPGKDEGLIRRARAFLDGHTSTERIYTRATGFHGERSTAGVFAGSRCGRGCGNGFVRTDGAPLDRGVPGIFTREGYRELFDKRLSEFVAAASADDAQVMGRENTQKRRIL